MNTILIENGTILTMDAENTIHAPGWVWVDDDCISAIGAGNTPADLQNRADRIIDAEHMAVLPGLVNGHTHLSQTFMRGLGDDKTLIEWLKTVMWPIQGAMTPEDMRLASLLGLVENLRCGVTSVVQHHKITTGPAHIDVTAEAAEAVGLRMQLSRGWVDLGSGAESPDAIIADVDRLRQRWGGQANGRISVAFGPMASWRCSNETMRRTVELARKWGIATHIHVAESRDEIEMMRQRNGLRHIEWLHSLDMLGPDIQLVHCVQIDEREIDLVAAGGATVIHCPVSNMYLASGAAPVSQMLAKSIPIALGSDGPASNNAQDILEAMKTAALLAKHSTGDAAVLHPLDVLRMATANGARLLGRTDLGHLTSRVKADITLVNLNTVHSMPVHSAANALVYNAVGPDVHTVIVDGRVLLDAGTVTVLNETDLLAECREAATSLLARVGVIE